MLPHGTWHMGGITCPQALSQFVVVARAIHPSKGTVRKGPTEIWYIVFNSSCNNSSTSRCYQCTVLPDFHLLGLLKNDALEDSLDVQQTLIYGVRVRIEWKRAAGISQTKSI